VAHPRIFDERVRHPTIFGGFTSSGLYWMKPARVSIRVAMADPSSWNTATAPIATKAAATAYSDSSNPVSSLKNFLTMIGVPFRTSRSGRSLLSARLLPDPALLLLIDLVGEVIDLDADVFAEKLESCDSGQCHEGCGNCVLG
jgi:hypothetical protein